MSLTITDNKLIVSPPNSESPIVAQHIGIKPRSVGSFYMSDISKEVLNWFNLGNNKYYIDFTRTLLSIEKIAGYVILKEREALFREKLKPQVEIIDNIRSSNTFYSYIEVPEPVILSNRKYFKLDTENEASKLIYDLLIGDCCNVVFKKLGDNVVVIYLDARNNFKETIDNSFNLKL